MAAEEGPRKSKQLADILVKIFSGLLGIVFIIFMIMFWFK
jgi:hypothetical protein